MTRVVLVTGSSRGRRPAPPAPSHAPLTPPWWASTSHRSPEHRGAAVFVRAGIGSPVVAGVVDDPDVLG